MRKHNWILFFLLLGFFACDDDSSVFEASTEGLEIKFTPVAGGAMMHYIMPNNRDIFAMHVRYPDWQGQEVLKVCDYSSDSLLLDGFTQRQEVNARISFVNHRNEESEAMEYSFSTSDSAPWAFFDDIQVNSSWDGFQVIYKSPKMVTGMAHVFYLGMNPLTQQEDTILVKSFPIRRGGDTLNFVLEQELTKSTVVVRTEDYQGYRVRQEIFPNIDAFRTEKWTVTADNFNDFGLSVENDTAKTGVKYLFDGDVKGRRRMEAFIAASGTMENMQGGIQIYGTYLAGPNALEKPLVLDLGEQKAPAWLRMYAIIPLKARHAASARRVFGHIWKGWYDDKLPCQVTVYGNKETGDPDAAGWVRLGGLNQDPKATLARDKWTYDVVHGFNTAPVTMEDFEMKKPLFVDIQFPPVDDTYRYLKIVVHQRFKTSEFGRETNENEYLTLHELEVFIKKN